MAQVIRKKMKLKSYRISEDLISRIKDRCGLLNMSESAFIRLASEEKLMRESVEKDLDIRVDTSDIQSLLVQWQGQINSQIVLMKDQQSSLEQRLNSKMDNVLNSIDKLSTIIVSGSLKDLENILIPESIEQKILSLLPSKYIDLMIVFDDAEQLNLTLANLKQKKVIQKVDNDIWRLV